MNSSPEGLQPFALVDPVKEAPEKKAALLEVRMEHASVYLRPTGFQLFCLQRAFRHFHVLPPQVLSGSNRRRVADLLATKVLKLDRPVHPGEVFGVIEQVHAKPVFETVPVKRVPVSVAEQQFAPSTASVKTAEASSQPACMPTTAAPSGMALVAQKKPAPARPPQVILPSKSGGFVVQDGSLWQWVVAGAAAAVCIPLIMATVYGISTLSSTPQARVSLTPTLPSQVVQQTPAAAAAVVAPAAVPVEEKHRHRPLASVQPASLNASSSNARAADAEERRFVSELPPGHFAHPVTTGSLAGEVRLKVMIGADGSVKQVTVLSGDPRLAQAAERAVMRWHYNPYGGPIAAETEIRMRFFGTDAVSIASVAGPAS